METVSKSNGNRIHFGNGFQMTWKPLLPLWILLRGIQNGLVTAFSGEEYVVGQHTDRRMGGWKDKQMDGQVNGRTLSKKTKNSLINVFG